MPKRKKPDDDDEEKVVVLFADHFREEVHHILYQMMIQLFKSKGGRRELGGKQIVLSHISLLNLLTRADC